MAMELIKQHFPNLGQDCKITSPETSSYNCIVWAAGVSDKFWWPDSEYIAFWPQQIHRRVTLESFIAAFETLRYARCESEEYEDGFEKIAILVDPFTIKPTHAARQLTTGRWTSKLGQSFDIEHDLREVCGQIYGTVGAVMKRTFAHKSTLKEC